MSIYSSDKVLPYVYICTHKTTEEFYIGSRYSKHLKLPSHLDFPKYKTSSKIIKQNFEDFNWFIVAEFFKSQDAYDFEQSLIFEFFDDPKCLNQSCYYKKLRFNSHGMNSPEAISKWKISHYSKDNLDDWKLLMSEVTKDWHNNMDSKTKQNISYKISLANLNRPKVVNDKISKTLTIIMENRTDEEWEAIKIKKQETWKMRKIKGIKNKTSTIQCPICLKNIRSCNYSRHVKPCSTS